MASAEFFFTPLWSMAANNHVAINNEVMSYASELVAFDKKGVSKTNSGGWQSDSIDVTLIPLLKNLIYLLTNEVRLDLKIIPEAVVIMNGCWININKINCYNRTHTHPNSMLSGTYYVKVPNDSGDLVFEDPRAQAVCIPFPVTEVSKYTMHTARFHPQVGSIVIFPSWLPHYVETNLSKEDRISVAFNLLMQ